MEQKIGLSNVTITINELLNEVEKTIIIFLY